MRKKRTLRLQDWEIKEHEEKHKRERRPGWRARAAAHRGAQEEAPGRAPLRNQGNSLSQGLHPLLLGLQLLLHLRQLAFQSGKLKTNDIFFLKEKLW